VAERVGFEPPVRKKQGPWFRGGSHISLVGAVVLNARPLVLETEGAYPAPDVLEIEIGFTDAEDSRDVSKLPFRFAGPRPLQFGDHRVLRRRDEHARAFDLDRLSPGELGMAEGTVLAEDEIGLPARVE
jgi:hypothetical protein